MQKESLQNRDGVVKTLAEWEGQPDHAIVTPLEVLDAEQAPKTKKEKKRK